MPATPEQTEYISDLFEQCSCDEHEVAAMLLENAQIEDGEWPRDAVTISWWNASDLIESLKNLKRDYDRPSGRRESRR